MKKCMGCMEEYEESLQICPHCGYDSATGPAEVYHITPGSILAYRYIVGKMLGCGGFGVTYLGYDAELERKVAIKEYLPGEFATRVPGQTQVTVYDGPRTEQFQSGLCKFVDETKRLAKFQNVPGIVHVFDVFQENNTAYIVMEYIDGETLTSRVKREGTIPEDEALAIVLPIAHVLQAVHKEGIIHRDIAPDNIMVDKQGKVSIIDFGASRFATTTHSKSLSVLIKQGYAPMEQYQSHGDQGPWTDVYALGATLYYMLTGVVPQDATERAARDELKPPSKVGAKISSNLDTTIMNAMNLKIQDRTQSMEQFEAELRSKQEVARLKVTKDKNDLGKWPRWMKYTMAAAAMLVIGFVALLTTGVISFQREEFGTFAISEESTTVPNLVNLAQNRAEMVAREKNLKIQIRDKQYSDQVKEDLVLSQEIAGGSIVEKNTELYLVISGGVETTAVPSVKGLMKDEAVNLLTDAKLKCRTEEVESSVAPGAIVEQYPEEREQVPIGTEIVLKVSIGLKAGEEDIYEEVEVPDLKGMSFEDAQKELEKLKLYIVKSDEVYDSSVKKGNIVSQSVPAGTAIMQGESVPVVVSAGKEQCQVPDVQFKTESAARNMVTSAGLKVTVSYSESETVEKGKVISQSVAKNSWVDKGTTVNIVVSSGAKEVQMAQETQPVQTSQPQTTQTPQTTQQPQTTPQPQPVVQPERQWSEWMTALPGGVSAANYSIETKTQYRYRDRATTSSGSSSLDGWELTGQTTQKGDFGNWSAWSETAVTGDANRNVETKTQYRTRSKETKKANTKTLSGWTYVSTDSSVGSWTESSTPVSAYNGEDYKIEVTTEERPIIKHQYYHVGYYIYIKSGMTWAGRHGPQYIFTWSENAQYSDAVEVLGMDYAWYDEVKCGKQDYGDGYYKADSGYRVWCIDEAGEDRQVGTETIYKSRKTTYTHNFYRYGSWSDWSDTNPNISDSNLVSTRTLYRYRDKQDVTTYYYQKWGAWSDFRDEAVSQTADREVETRTLYRYK